MERVLMGLVLAGWVASAPASAQDTIRLALHYQSPDGCPDARGFRDRVVSRLGYDPFDASSRDSLDVRVTEDRGFRARLELSGALSGAREIGPNPSCAELIAATATTVSILIDPLASPADETNDAPIPETTGVTSRTTLSTPQTERGPSIDIGFAPRIGPAIGFSPQVMLDAELVGAVRIGENWSVELGPRIRHTLVETAVNSDALRIGLYTARAAGCFSGELWLACIGAEVGGYVGDAITRASTRSEIFGSAGVRGGLSIPVAAGVALEVLLDVNATWTPLRIWLDGSLAWEALPIAGSLLLGARFFPPLW